MHLHKEYVLLDNNLCFYTAQHAGFGISHGPHSHVSTIIHLAMFIFTRLS